MQKPADVAFNETSGTLCISVPSAWCLLEELARKNHGGKLWPRVLLKLRGDHTRLDGYLLGLLDLATTLRSAERHQ